MSSVHPTDPHAISPVTSWEVAQLAIDIYKHHFDLFFKAYFAHLVIVGAVAGYVVRPETDRMSKLVLLAFAILVVLVAIGLWSYGLRWHRSLVAQLERCISDSGLAVNVVSLLKVALVLGEVGSVITLVVGITALVHYY